MQSASIFKCNFAFRIFIPNLYTSIFLNPGDDSSSFFALTSMAMILHDRIDEFGSSDLAVVINGFCSKFAEMSTLFEDISCSKTRDGLRSFFNDDDISIFKNCLELEDSIDGRVGCGWEEIFEQSSIRYY